MKNETIKIICPNCQEDITYYFNKGKAQEQERILKEINYFETNFKLSIGIMFEELRSKIKGDEE